MNEPLVANLEDRLGCKFPDDYRGFLLSHRSQLLAPCLEFAPPKSGVIDMLLTIEELIENDDRSMSGIPEKGLLHIGGNILGGYLYLRVTDEGFGEVHYSEGYVFKELFPNFGTFLATCIPGDA